MNACRYCHHLLFLYRHSLIDARLSPSSASSSFPQQSPLSTTTTTTQFVDHNASWLAGLPSVTFVVRFGHS
jgi:hypothetical protein